MAKVVTYWQLRDRIENEISKSVVCEIHYSCYKEVGDGKVEDNLDDVAVEGTVVFIRHAYDGSYRSKPITNPTWMDVCKVANESIHVTDDYHHVYLEGISPVEDGVYAMTFGS